MSSQVVGNLAAWTDWVPLLSADPPLSPGVYLARQGATGPLVYVGVGAGERKAGGLRGRLRRYTSGKALASGLGEAVFDRALADPQWLRERVAEVECGRAMRATGWGKAVVQLPTYAPDLNPTEGVWSLAKREVGNLAAASLSQVTRAASIGSRSSSTGRT